MLQDSDGRRAPRVSVSQEVVIEYGDRRLRATAMDVSERGMSVWVSDKAPHEPLRITMAVDNRPVILSGQVAREFESDGGGVWGIEFEAHEDTESYQILKAVIEAQS